jgi:type VI secretion system protein ImpK
MFSVGPAVVSSMTSPTVSSAAPAPAVPSIGTGRLALSLQEALTAIVRLRANRQPISDAGAFRAHMLQLFARAEQEGRAAGYEPKDVQMAVFAVVALLDESVLNAGQPALSEWARQPLNQELFGTHMAGEWVFQNVDQLLARSDTLALADLLEVHQLIFLLGFRGRYGVADPAALHAYTSRVGDRIGRLRGVPGDLAPSWRPGNDAVAGRDPWIRPLAVGVVTSLLLAVALWSVGAFSLRGTTSELQSMSGLAAPAAPRR